MALSTPTKSRDLQTSQSASTESLDAPAALRSAGHSLTLPGLDTALSPHQPRAAHDESEVDAINHPEHALGHHLRPKGRLKVSSSAMDMRHGASHGPSPVVHSGSADGSALSDAQRNATALSAEGVNHYKKKRYQEALKCFIRVRDMLVEAVGSRHREVANALNNMALVYRKLKDLKRASSLYEDALAIDLVTLEKHDPLIATTMFNLARVQEEDKQLGRALNLYQSALDIRRVAVKEHPDMDETSIAKILYHLAFVQKRLGNQHAFHTAMAEATGIYVRVYGHDHKRTQGSIEQLLAGGDLTRSKSGKLKKRGSSKESLVAAERAESRKKALGPISESEETGEEKG